MEYSLASRPAYTVAEVALDPGESLTAQAGAMVSHTDSIRIETGIGDSSEGLFESVKDSILGHESFFRNRFTAEDRRGTVTVAPTLPGDMAAVELADTSLYCKAGAYVAGPSAIELDTDLGGFNSLLGGEGLFFLQATGTGPLFVSSFGGLVEHELESGEVFTVDSGHAVAWDEGVDFDTDRIGGLKETLFSDEGLVLRFSGPGRVFVQTRNYESFVSDIVARVPSGGSGGGSSGGGFQFGF